jgi:opacity protein-like surface antigen
MVRQPFRATSVRFDAIDYEGRSFSPPVYYGYRGAYFFGPDGWFGVEAEVVHMKVYARVHRIVPAAGALNGIPISGTIAADDVVQRFSLSHGQNMLLINGVVRRVFGAGGRDRNARLAAEGRVGAGPTLPHVESTIGGVAEEKYERGAVAWQAAAGVELRVYGRLYALGEYKFTRCRQSVTAAAQSTVETLLSSHHVAFGASWHF